MSTVSADLLTALSAALPGGAASSRPAPPSADFDQHLSHARAGAGSASPSGRDATPGPARDEVPAAQSQRKEDPAGAKTGEGEEDSAPTTAQTAPSDRDADDSAAEADASAPGNEVSVAAEAVAAEALVAAATVAATAEEPAPEMPQDAPAEPASQPLGGKKKAAPPAPVGGPAASVPDAASVPGEETAGAAIAGSQAAAEAPREAGPVKRAEAEPNPVAPTAAVAAQTKDQQTRSKTPPADAKVKTALKPAEASAQQDGSTEAAAQPVTAEAAVEAPDATASTSPDARQTPAPKRSPAAKPESDAPAAQAKPAAVPVAQVALPERDFSPSDEPREQKPIAERVETIDVAKPAPAAQTSAPQDRTSATPAGAAGAAAPGNTEASSQARQAEHARFAQRVSRAFEAVGQRNGSVRLKLSPPELGSLRLEVIVQQGVLSARLEAETPAARNLLLESLPVLRERLAQQDIRIERFDVDLMDRNPGGSPQQPGTQSDSGRQPPRRAPSDSQTPDAAASRPAESRTPRASGESSHLNVVI